MGKWGLMHGMGGGKGLGVGCLRVWGLVTGEETVCDFKVGELGGDDGSIVIVWGLRGCVPASIPLLLA